MLAGSGLLLWIGSGGLVTWAEQRADSGIAETQLAGDHTHIWGRADQAALDRPRAVTQAGRIAADRLRRRGPLVLAFLPLGNRAGVWAVIGLLIAPLTWVAGSIWIARRRPGLHDRGRLGLATALFGLGFLAVIALTSEPRPAPATEAWLAWAAYLTVFGSIVAFTSYVHRAAPAADAGGRVSFTYASPVIAVLLGHLILGEPVTSWTLGGAVLVMAGIAGVFNIRPPAPKKGGGTTGKASYPGAADLVVTSAGPAGVFAAIRCRAGPRGPRGRPGARPRACAGADQRRRPLQRDANVRTDPRELAQFYRAAAAS
ncbi:MAG: EamA family transporter [bacterium]|nr:EamA family transporter [bacterium]